MPFGQYLCRIILYIRVNCSHFVVSTRSTSSSSNIVAASTLEGKPSLCSAPHNLNLHHPSAGTETNPTSAPTPDSQSQSTAESEPQPADAKSGAFDPETGEINWDCPCLGGMAHGPCGPEFREAFSCFVYSEKEPKGIDCVEKFRGMQDCFREHPEVYAEGASPVSFVQREENLIRTGVDRACGR